MTAILDKGDGTKWACKEFKGPLWSTCPECGGIHLGDDSLSFWLEDIIGEELDWGHKYRIAITVRMEKLEEAKE